MKQLNNKLIMKFILPGLFLAFCLTIPGFTSGYMLRVLNIALITYLCVLSLYVILVCAVKIPLLRPGFGE